MSPEALETYARLILAGPEREACEVCGREGCRCLDEDET